MNSDEFNPYAAPGSTAGQDALSDFYRFDFRRLSYRELWRISGGFIPFAVFAIHKTFRLPIRMISPSSIPRMRTLDFVERDQIPEEVWDRWHDAVRDLNEAGLKFNFALRIPTLNPKEINFTACFIADDEMTSAGCSYSRMPGVAPERALVAYTVSSLLADGRFATTLTGSRGLDTPNLFLANHVANGSMAQLLDAHRDWIRTLEFPTVRLERARHAERILGNWEKEYEFNLKRKFYVPIPATECEAILHQMESAPSPPQGLDTPFDQKLNLALIVLMPLSGLLWLLGSIWPALRGAPFRIVILAFFLLLAVRYIRTKHATSRLEQPNPESMEEL